MGDSRSVGDQLARLCSVRDADQGNGDRRAQDQGRIPRALIGIAVLGVLLRVAHVLFGEASPYAQAPIMDARYHLDWARAFALGQEIHTEAYFRAPLYPWFLGVLNAVFGENLLAWRLVQCLLGGATVFLTGLLALRVFGRAQGNLAALIMAVAWVPLHFDTELLIPVLFLPLLLGALITTLGLHQHPGGKSALCTGLLWGLATITRPNVLLFAPVFFFWVRGRAQGRAGWILALLFSVGWILPVLPITVRNRVVGGEWTLVATQAGVNLWIGNNPQSDGSTAIVPGTRAGWWEGSEDARRQAEVAEGESLTPGRVSAHYMGRVLNWMEQDPGAFLRHLGTKTRLLLSSRELGNNLEPTFFATHYDPLANSWLLPFGSLLGFGLVGAFLGRKRTREQFPLFVFVPLYGAGVVAFFMCSRFRLPIWPVMAVFASHGMLLGVCAIRGAQARRAAGVLLPAFGIWALSVWITPSNLLPSESIGEMQLGDAAMGLGQHGLAAEHYSRATAHERVSPHARLGLARAFLELERLDQAQAILDELLQHKGFPEAREDRLRVELKARRYSEAVALAQNYLDNGAPEPGVLYQLGRARFFLEDYRSAEETLARVLHLDRRHLGAAFARARSLDELHEDSLEAWTLAADLYLSTSSETVFVEQALSRAVELTRARGQQQRAEYYAAELQRWLAKHQPN
ncbi:MAG: tetratricopeptide repeat protein [bacterium]